MLILNIYYRLPFITIKPITPKNKTIFIYIRVTSIRLYYIKVIKAARYIVIITASPCLF
ncbi:uncharacterized protein BKA55DRAFT_722770 [Fusarium redolens]|uniref:Uncharacterized protein n=1 Tax=Fusarium redolens TaxID=48865 RepID=A0A9P9FWS4_FUSRE|nr:uncharacterized protein BKA55DRAFT_722770 [Fusarium redolens]KAH7205105.1 hypothetical protein BKA55DRAFT_722770 [Fusarium redolens]